MPQDYRFSFGPWNIHEGADPFGPSVRKSVDFNRKLALYKPLGFDGIQLHDDDAVPDLDNLSADKIASEAKALSKQLDGHGLVPEFVAPRLWENPRTVDGAFTANDPASRAYARERAHKTIDIARAMGVRDVVLWFAREGTYIREAKDSKRAVDRIAAAIRDMLEYDPDIRILIEPKPNEPMDHSYIPTVGHALGLGMLAGSPDRVGCLIESAHAILAGLDPSDEMGYALAHGKLWSVHLNDQNGLKFDQDKTFGSVDLRRALNQVRILDKHDYGKNGEWVGLDVKAMRTQREDESVKHLGNSLKVFKALLKLSRSMDDTAIEALIAERDYEALEMYVLGSFLGGVTFSSQMC